MATLRDIRRRIASVQNTRKITKAMEMVAAAKLRRNQARIEALRPYAGDMIEMMTDLATYSEETEARLKDAVTAYHNSFAADPSITPEVAEIEAEVEATEAEA